MGKTSTNAQEILPEFQKYLIEKKLAPERNITFLAYWVSRFLTFGRKKDIATDDYNESAVLEFLDILRADEKILDWQPRQADDALKLYYFHYLGKTRSHITGAATGGGVPSTIEELRRLIRLRHYSYSTERTYMCPLGSGLHS